MVRGPLRIIKKCIVNSLWYTRAVLIDSRNVILSIIIKKLAYSSKDVEWIMAVGCTILFYGIGN